eukprot:TRINITY_DN27786_c0_g1_i1.p1 TRINITY_DN27786_c0_g1~~TRINITY_DN27786_c0_g1_i1.p1  ORF type:complete len:366 (+),score=47.19 TRINITY_DN27786_c0_g1_i1:2-1099(+)
MASTLVQKITIGFRQMMPLSPLLELIDALFSTYDANEQHQLVAAIVDDKVTTAYPPLRSYSLRFYKYVINKYESRGDEVDEGLLERYLSILNQTPSGDETCFKSYQTDLTQPDQTVTIRIAAQYNQVGLTIWTACFLLSDFVLQHPDLFHGRRCLELGAGTGLSSLFLCRAARPSSLVITDYVPQVMTNLVGNLLINGFEIECVAEDQAHNMASLPGASSSKIEPLKHTSTAAEWWCSGKYYGTQVDVCTLDWQDMHTSSAIPQLEDIDTIIAADVAYDTRAIPHLMRALTALLSPETHQSEEHQPSRVAYIATTVRNPDTFQVFNDQLTEAGLHYENITKDCNHSPLFYYPKEDIIMYKIYSER